MHSEIRAELTTLPCTHKSQFVTTLISSVNTRFARYNQSEDFQTAAIFDPRWKLDCRPDVTRYTNLLIEKIPLQYRPNEMEESETTSTLAKKRCKIFKFMASQSTPISISKEPSQTQAETYHSQPTISENAEPLIYWQQHQEEFPQLTKVALWTLQPPLHHPLLKDDFRLPENFRPERCRISDDRFEELMFIKCNSNYQRCFILNTR